MRLPKYLSLDRVETILVTATISIAVIVFVLLAQRFVTENSITTPIPGGVYTEGAVGILAPDYTLNPLFSRGVETDIASLIFDGMLVFNPETGKIEESLATMALSEDKKTYTFTIKPDIYWHDGTELTSADVVYTFREVIQNPEFPNELLKEAFRGVSIEQISKTEVSFTIPEVRKGFVANFMTPLLPRHILFGTAVADLPRHPFNREPIGSGPFVFAGVENSGAATNVTVTANENYFRSRPMLDQVVFRIYPDYSSLIINQSEIDGIRPLPSHDAKKLSLNDRFEAHTAYPDDYLAVYFNLKTDTLTTREVRQAMRAVVDTTALADKYDGKRVDTPLTELWPQDNIVNISYERADELMSKAGYTFPDVTPPPVAQPTVDTADTPAIEPEPEPDTNTESKDASTSETTSAAQPDTGSDTPRASTRDNTTPATENTNPNAAEKIPADTPAAENAQAAQGGPEPARFVTEPEPYTAIIIDTDVDAYLVGNTPDGTKSVAINDYVLQQFDASSGTFRYNLSERLATIREGDNAYLIRFFDGSGDEIDRESVSIFYTPNTTLAQQRREERDTEPEPAQETDGQTVVEEATPEPEPEPEPIVEPIQEAEIITDTPASNAVYRTNRGGNHITLHLAYLESQANASDIVNDLQKYWTELGIEIILDPLDAQQFREALRNRNYELILAGQSLGYDPEPYPYFHLSQAETGLNIANWKDLKASLLMEEIRKTHDPDLRFDALSQLRDIIIDQVPGIFLMSPEYTWYRSEKLKNVPEQIIVKQLQDRMYLLHSASVKADIELSPDKSLFDFFGWFWDNSKALFSS